MFLNIPTGQNEKAQITELSEKLGISDPQILSVIRFPSTGNTSAVPLVKVVFTSVEEKKRYLKKDVRIKLKALDSRSPYKKVRFYEDQTKQQTQETKKMLRERYAKNQALIREFGSNPEDIWIITEENNLIKVKNRDFVATTPTLPL